MRGAVKGENGGRGRNGATRKEDSNFVLDELDERIIAALRQNGRIPNRDLARSLEVNEATVRIRLRRLEEANMVRVVAMRDLGALGFEYVAPVGIQVKGRSAAQVGEEIARLDRVITVNVTIGKHDLEIQVVAKSLPEMEHLLTNVVAQVEGVERIFPSLALKVFKYNPEWAPL